MEKYVKQGARHCQSASAVTPGKELWRALRKWMIWVCIQPFLHCAEFLSVQMELVQPFLRGQGVFEHFGPQKGNSVHIHQESFLVMLNHVGGSILTFGKAFRCRGPLLLKSFQGKDGAIRARHLLLLERCGCSWGAHPVCYALFESLPEKGSAETCANHAGEQLHLWSVRRSEVHVSILSHQHWRG